jgi:hypothetical protein
MPLEKQHEDIIGSTFDELQSKISMLEEQNASLTLLQTDLRDKAAIILYAGSFITNPLALNANRLSNESKAVQAFKRAEAFMRIREQGQSYENEIVEDIQTLIDEKPNDQDLGEAIRQVYRNQV